MFYWVAKKGKFHADKLRFDKTDPAVLLLCQRPMYFCRFIANVRQISLPSQLLYIRCPLAREHKQKKNPILIFKT